jgi:isoleucyl-tRNA synthetase
MRKDVLYCDLPLSPKRRAVRTVLDLIFEYLVRWLSPVLCFTAEEAWLIRHGDGPESSVHLETYCEVPADWRDVALGEKIDLMRNTLRRTVTGAIELKRAAKKIGSSLQARALNYVTDPSLYAKLKDIDLAANTGTSVSTIELISGPLTAIDQIFVLPDVSSNGSVIETATSDKKCERCWKVLPEVGEVHEHPDLCKRCASAVDELAAKSGSTN